MEKSDIKMTKEMLEKIKLIPNDYERFRASFVMLNDQKGTKKMMKELADK